MAAGKTLTRDERSILRKAQGEGEAEGAAIVKNYTELAAILGITRRALQDWRKKEGAPKPATNGNHDVVAWKAFQVRIDGKGAEKIEDPEDEKGLPSEPILKRRKLLLYCEEKEIELARKRGELIEVATVREEIAKKIASATAHLRKRFENELPSELEGADAATIHEANVSALDEFFELMSGGDA